MKTRTTIATIFTTSILAMAPMIASADVIDASLVGRYNFDAAPVGNVIVDTGENATVVNALSAGTTWAASIDDGSMTRSGVALFTAADDNRITIPNHADYNGPTASTLTFWVKTLGATNAGGGNHSAMLVDRRGASTVWSQFPDGTIFKQTNGEIGATSGDINTDTWRHIAFTMDETPNGSQQVFIDGALVGTATLDGNDFNSNEVIELGNSHDAFWFSYQGYMDDFRIYDRKLSAAEILDVATSSQVPEPTSALLAALGLLGLVCGARRRRRRA